MVDRVEPARVGEQTEAHDSDQHGKDKIDDLPPAANFVVGHDPIFDPPLDVGGDGFDKTQDDAGRKFRAHLQPGLHDRERLYDRRRGSQQAIAQQKRGLLDDRPRRGEVVSSASAPLRRMYRFDADEQRAQKDRRSNDVVSQTERIGRRRVPGQTVRRRKMGGEVRPPVAAAMRLADRDMRIGKECVAPLLMAPTARSGAELGIAFAQKLERVFVVAEPDMQTVFFDPSGPAATGRPFAAEPPAGLIDGQLISPLVLRARQFERRGHRGAASADHRDFDRP